MLALLVTGVRTLTELQILSELNVCECTDALRSLQGQGYVIIEGPPGSVQAKLTPSGEQFW